VPVTSKVMVVGVMVDISNKPVDMVVVTEDMVVDMTVDMDSSRTVTVAMITAVREDGVLVEEVPELNTETKVKTLPDGPEITAKSLWEENGAVVMIVRRPG